MAKITGLGGVFYVSPDPEAARTWYREVLGVDGPYGPQFLWSDDRSEHAYSLMSAFPDDEYLKPSTHGFMVNFRVDDLDGFVEGLEAKGSRSWEPPTRATASSRGCSIATGSRWSAGSRWPHRLRCRIPPDRCVSDRCVLTAGRRV